MTGGYFNISILASSHGSELQASSFSIIAQHASPMPVKVVIATTTTRIDVNPLPLVFSDPSLYLQANSKQNSILVLGLEVLNQLNPHCECSLTQLHSQYGYKIRWLWMRGFFGRDLSRGEVGSPDGLKENARIFWPQTHPTLVIASL